LGSIILNLNVIPTIKYRINMLCILIMQSISKSFDEAYGNKYTSIENEAVK